MPTVDLNELQGAVVWVSTGIMDNEAFICRQTGKIYWISGDGGLDESDDGPAGDVYDLEKYVPVPHRHDLDIGNNLAFEFVSRILPDQFDAVRALFRRKGAYARFAELLAQNDLLQSWYAYSEKRTLSALRKWCDTQGFMTER